MAHYALHKFHWTPSQVNNLSREELAFVAASIQLKVEAESKEQRELERKAKTSKTHMRRR